MNSPNPQLPLSPTPTAGENPPRQPGDMRPIHGFLTVEEFHAFQWCAMRANERRAPLAKTEFVRLAVMEKIHRMIGEQFDRRKKVPANLAAMYDAKAGLQRPGV